MITVTYCYRVSARVGFKSASYTCTDMEDAEQLVKEIQFDWIPGEVIEISDNGATISYLEHS